MNTIKFKAGMASKFFVTDVDTMTFSAERPYLVLCRKEFNTHVLAKVLAMINEKVKTSGFLNSFRKKFNAADCEADLINLYEQGNAKLPVINRQLVVFSTAIDKKTLVIMKILKLKGMVELVAIQSGELESLEAVKREVESQKIDEASDVSFYGPVNLNIVSGIEQTIVSLKQDKQILNEFPEIIVKEDLKELFFEGLRPELK